MLSPFDQDTYVVHMIAQHGLGGVAISYSWLASCLIKLRRLTEECHASIHAPLIGCGLAGGKWPNVEALIENLLTKYEIPVTIYTQTK